MPTNLEIDDELSPQVRSKRVQSVNMHAFLAQSPQDIDTGNEIAFMFGKKDNPSLELKKMDSFRSKDEQLGQTSSAPVPPNSNQTSNSQSKKMNFVSSMFSRLNGFKKETRVKCGNHEILQYNDRHSAWSELSAKEALLQSVKEVLTPLDVHALVILDWRNRVLAEETTFKDNAKSIVKGLLDMNKDCEPFCLQTDSMLIFSINAAVDSCTNKHQKFLNCIVAVSHETLCGRKPALEQALSDALAKRYEEINSMDKKVLLHGKNK